MKQWLIKTIALVTAVSMTGSTLVYSEEPKTEEFKNVLPNPKEVNYQATNVVQVSLGAVYSAVITEDGNLYMWGNNNHGQLGDGTNEGKNIPTKIMGNVSSVSLGIYSDHNAAITNDGSLYMWGDNFCGQLGNGTNEDEYVPTKIMDNVSSVSLGGYHSAAVTNDGSLYMWGNNGCGQLGDGTIENKYVPTKIMDNVSTVSLGDFHSMAITNDGSLYMWGNNCGGQLGDGTNIDKYVPTKVMDNVSSVRVGRFYNAAITNDGNLYMWGYNCYGQLGDGTNEDKYVPTKVMDNISSVSLSYYNHSAAITNDGILYTWGGNWEGQLGDGTTKNKYLPTKVMDNVSSVNLEQGYSGAITNDGSLYMWGDNYYGQLGDGTNEDKYVPTKIMDNVSSVSLEQFHSSAITNDGSLYMWGYNYNGQLGDGTTEDKNIPVKIEIPLEPSDQFPPDYIVLDPEYDSDPEIDFERTSYILPPDETLTVTARYLGSDELKNVLWYTDNPHVISVEGTADYPGKKMTEVTVKPLAEGNAHLFLTCNDGKIAYVKVEVVGKRLAVTSKRPKLHILVGEEFDVMSDVVAGDKTYDNYITYGYDETAFELNYTPRMITEENRNSFEHYLFPAKATFKARKEGVYNITVTDSVNNLVKVFTVTVDDKANDSCTIYSVPSFHIYEDFKTNFANLNGIYIDSFRSRIVEESGKKTCTVEFDAYNTRMVYGIADIYNAQGELVKSRLISPNGGMASGIKEAVWDDLWELGSDFVTGDILTYRQHSYSKLTHVELTDIPLDGYIVITNNPCYSPSLFFVDGLDICFSYYSFAKSNWKYDKVKDDLMYEVVGNAKVQDVLKNFRSNYELKFYETNFEEKIYESFMSDFTSANGKDIYINGDFVKFFTDFLNQFDLENLILGIAKDFAIGTTENIFMTASGFVGSVMKLCFGWSKSVNLICKLQDFKNSVSHTRQIITVPNDGSTARYEDISVSGESIDEYTSLNVFRLSLDEDIKEILPDISNEVANSVYEYEITLCKGNEVTQPDSPVTVSMVVPTNLADYIKYLKIARVQDDGTVVNIPITGHKDSFGTDIIYFQTDHFSKYCLYLSTAEGSVILCGDVDTDGTLTTNDALLTIQASFGEIALLDEQLFAADIDGDGELTTNDALLIIQSSFAAQ